MKNKRKKYLELFNLSEHVSIDEIKKRYRELAKINHPDVNKETNAKEHFILIKEAYEYLINSPLEKSQSNYYENVVLEKDRIEKIRLAKERLNEYYQRRNYELKRQIEEFKSGYIYRIYKICIYFSSLLLLILLLDSFINTNKSKEIVLESSREVYGEEQNTFILLKTDKRKIYVNSKIYNYLGKSNNINIVESRILKTPYIITISDDINRFQQSNLSFIHILKFIFALFVLYGIYILNRKITSIGSTIIIKIYLTIFIPFIYIIYLNLIFLKIF